MRDKRLLTDKEIQLLGRQYEEADHSPCGVSLNEYILKAQLAKVDKMVDREKIRRIIYKGHDSDGLYSSSGIADQIIALLKGEE